MKKFKIDITFIITSICFLLSPLQKEYICILICLFIHELGHIFFIYIFKCNIKSIKLTCFGFLLDTKLENLSFSKELLICFGGILFNIIGFGLFKPLRIYMLILIIMNIIPIYPLDGYRCIKCIISYFIPYKISLYICSIFSLILIIISFFILSRFFDYLLVFNVLYLLILNIIELKKIKVKYEVFLLDRYLNKYSFSKKEVSFRHNNCDYLYRYNCIYIILKDNIIEENDILKLKYL